MAGVQQPRALRPVTVIAIENPDPRRPELLASRVLPELDQKSRFRPKREIDLDVTERNAVSGLREHLDAPD